MKTLKHGQQVKIESFKFRPEIIVGTQKGYYDESSDNYKNLAGPFVEKKNEDYAYTIRSASILTANYPGKAEEMQEKRLRYENAVSLVDGETVLIDNREFKVLVTGEQYSDCIHFKEVK